MAAPSFRHYLRERTRDAHARLDALVGPLDGDRQYRRFLRGLYAYRAPVEGFLAEAEWPSSFGGWRPSPVAGLLAQDLGDLGEPAPHPRAADLSNDMETLIGVSYVLEGSALGARILVKQAAVLGYDEARGARHLWKQAAELENWRRFIALIDEFTGIDRARVAQAADASFAQAAQSMGADDEH